MARSPIEMMVEKTAMQDDAAVAKALERVATAAVAWHFARAEDRMTSSIARKLDGAAAKLAELGWR